MLTSNFSKYFRAFKVHPIYKSDHLASLIYQHISSEVWGTKRIDEVHGAKITVDYNQCIVTAYQVAKELGLDRDNVRNKMVKLEKAGLILTKKLYNCTLVTLLLNEKNPEDLRIENKYSKKNNLKKKLKTIEEPEANEKSDTPNDKYELLDVRGKIKIYLNENQISLEEYLKSQDVNAEFRLFGNKATKAEFDEIISKKSEQ